MLRHNGERHLGEPRKLRSGNRHPRRPQIRTQYLASVEGAAMNRTSGQRAGGSVDTGTALGRRADEWNG